LNRLNKESRQFRFGIDEAVQSLLTSIWSVADNGADGRHADST
jgi:hypothetical protein